MGAHYLIDTNTAIELVTQPLPPAAGSYRLARPGIIARFPCSPSAIVSDSSMFRALGSGFWSVGFMGVSWVSVMISQPAGLFHSVF